jgi:hypothetical protein
MYCDGDFRSLSLITPGGEGFWDGILYDASEWLCCVLAFPLFVFCCGVVYCVLCVALRLWMVVDW